MQTFKIATWNVNSLRVRLEHVLSWLDAVKPDVLALQEIKLTDNDFPCEAFRAAGYEFVFSGQKTYNGVAILSLKPALEIVKDLPDFEDTQRRLLAGVIGGVRIINLYVPNGESVSSDKYQYKLNWLKKLDVFLKREIQQYSKVVVVGDFNIAPEEIDVHDAAYWEGKVLFSLPERNAFKEMLQAGLVDCYRYLNPEEQGFSWWDYRMNAFKRNLGVRIDHILATSPSALQCVNCKIDKGPRALERPSDHAPVVAEFELSR